METGKNGLELADKLRSSCYLENGFYFEDNVEESAVAMIGLSQYYFKLRNKDKRNYLYAAGLLAAAKVRLPGNDDADMYMVKLWEELMAASGAKNTATDLFNIIAELQDKVSKMRNHVEREIKDIPKVAEGGNKHVQEQKKIEATRKIFLLCNEKYIDIMRYTSDECCQILFGSELPCEFAHLVFGSVARMEGSPFSDFENAILISEKSDAILDQFQFYVVLFQFLIINLGETPIRLLGIPLLNDFYSEHKSKDWFYDKFTPSGIRFDSNEPEASVHPLSRKPTADKPFTVDLIGSANEMACLLDNERALLNGYHLADVVCRSRLVAGSFKLHEEYRTKVDEKLRNNQDWIRERIKNCMETLDAADELCTPVSKRNIKLLIYRGISVTISHLGNLFGARSSSCFDIVDELVESGRMSADAGHNLKYAVALAGEIRLKIYMEAGQQVPETDLVGKENGKEMSDIISAVGEVSICDHFYIAQTLWRDLHPFVMQESATISFSSVRDIDPMMRDVIRINLLGETGKQETFQQLVENRGRGRFDKISFLQIARTATNHLLTIFELFSSMLKQEQASNLVNSETSILPKISHLKTVFSHCNTLFTDSYSSANAPENLQTTFFADQETAHREYTRAMETLQGFLLASLKDERVVKVIPNVTYTLCCVAEFVSSFNRQMASFLQNTDTSKTVCFLKELDDISTALEDIRLSLPKSEVDLKEYVDNLRIVQSLASGFDDGLFSQEGFETGVNRWLEQAKVVKSMFLIIDQIPIFHEKVNNVVEFILDIDNWSFVMPIYCIVVARDLNILSATVKSTRGELLSRQGEYVLATDDLRTAHRILTDNSRDKDWFRLRVAANMHEIGKNFCFCGNYHQALVWFRKELNYRLSEVPTKTGKEHLGPNYHFQAKCLRGIGTEESMAEADMFVESEMELFVYD